MGPLGIQHDVKSHTFKVTITWTFVFVTSVRFVVSLDDGSVNIFVYLI